MKYLLLWLALAPSGSISSGSATFDDKRACELAGEDMTVLAQTFHELHQPHVRLLYECKPAASAEP